MTVFHVCVVHKPFLWSLQNQHQCLRFVLDVVSKAIYISFQTRGYEAYKHEFSRHLHTYIIMNLSVSLIIRPTLNFTEVIRAGIFSYKKKLSFSLVVHQ